MATGLGVGEPALQAGDADQNLEFDQQDLVMVQIAAKYMTGEPATADVTCNDNVRLIAWSQRKIHNLIAKRNGGDHSGQGLPDLLFPLLLFPLPAEAEAARRPDPRFGDRVDRRRRTRRGHAKQHQVAQENVVGIGPEARVTQERVIR